jgi:hypothetical protein
MADPAFVPAPRPGRFLSSQVRALLAALAIAAVLGVAALPWLLSSPARMSRLIAGAVPELQGDVRIGSVRLGWTGPIVLEDVAIVPRAGGAPPIRVRRIEASRGLAAILLSGGDVGRLRVEGLEADVAYDEEHRSNLAGLFVPAEAAAASAGPAGKRRARKSPLRLRLEVAGAIVRMRGPWAGEPWESDPIDVRATLAPAADGDWSEWTLEPVQLLADARMEPGVAQGVLAYIAPVLADATRTSGRFSLRIDGARLPVGEPAAGQVAGVLAMHEVVLGPGPLVERLFEALPGRLPAPPAIRIADEANVKFRLADRRVWHEGLEFGLPLAKPGQRLDVNSSGSVGLDDKSLDVRLSLPIPADLPQDKPLLAALAGKRVSLGIGGFLEKPKVNFDGSIKATAGEVLGDFLDRVRGGSPPRPVPPAVNQPGAAAPPQPGWKPEGTPPGDTVPAAAAPASSGDATAEAIVDLVGGVLEEVAKRRAERRAAEAANPEQVPPPRRGRLLRRLVPSPEPAGEPAPAPQAAPAP